MALRLSGTNCWISTKCSKNGDGYFTHAYCINRMRGLRCPREGVAGTKPFELGPECFVAVSATGRRAQKK